ncbi:MAG: efflux RND transporter permease subunit [Bacteroidales bacterium]|nr:efflux RND transporter permease subunit [Bacteroidales bacterium]
MKLREFKITTASLKNKNTIYLLIVLMVISGLMTYRTLPKEMFPEVALPMIMVQTPYPGNAPVDMENLVTRPIEKEVFTVDGIKNMSSNSSQDNSSILIEFNSDVNIKTALQDVKDAVDRSKNGLPDDLPVDPMVLDIDPSEFPVININISGEYSTDELKDYAEYLEERIEDIKQVSKVNISGLEDKLIRINLDKRKMDSYHVTFNDVENAIKYENMSVSGGDIIIGNTRRSVRTDGEFKSVDQLDNIIVKSENFDIVYLKDVLKDGHVIDGYKDVQSISRLNGEPVVSIQVIKKAGENLIETSEQISEIIKAAKKAYLPEELTITITNDQSDMVRKMIRNLENSIIMGILFVMFVLFFFLGTRNAMFVGIAIPMSMFISFVILGAIGSTVNMIVLFSLILALGMLVDNAIVAVENIHRFRARGYTAFEAAKLAVGEIAWAIIASTATTLAAFIPLLFWPGMMGAFMGFLPTTLIIVLASSLFVALVIIPAITIIFKSKGGEKPPLQRTLKISGILTGFSLLFYQFSVPVLGSLMIIIVIITFLNYFVFFKVSVWFQNVILVKLESLYLRFLKYALSGNKPYMFLGITILLLFGTIIFMGVRNPKVNLFPVNEPKYFLVKSELPVGTDITATDSISKIVEKDIIKILTDNDFYKDSLVESVITTVGVGAVGENEILFESSFNRTITTINFVDYEFRKGKNTSIIMRTISDSLIGKYPGVITSVEKNAMGPPTGKPVNIEISGEDFNKLVFYGDTVLQIINNANIPGIEGLKIDLELAKPELLITVDREKVRRFGMSTGQIAMTIRTALFGKEISDLKVGEEEYPIQIQLAPEYRNDISTLLNQIITFRDASTGKFIHVPIASVADFKYTSSYSAVKRIDNKRVITVYSNILEGANATDINNKIRKILDTFEFEDGYAYDLTGEQQDQEETQDFLMKAMLIALALIIIIMVTQFNSVIKPFIIIATVIFSIIGVLGGIATFKMDFIIIMSGVGIISLAGIVVNNGIVLIDYIDYLKNIRKQELGLKPDDNLPFSETVKYIIQGGQTRLRPVLLTAITTILGLLPMATGFNIDFAGLLSEFKPGIYFGGDNALFWGPMAWTVIFGLTFATFLTLIMVPVMYLIGNRIKLRVSDKEKMRI